MSAHSFIWVGDDPLFSFRESYFREFAALFLDVERSSHGAAFFEASATTIQERMDALGFDLERCSAAVREFAPEEVREEEQFEAWVERFLNGKEAEVPFHSWGVEPCVALRAILSECPNGYSVGLDLTDVIGRGYEVDSATLCADAFAEVSRDRSTFQPTVVLTEGRSDAELLGRALAVRRSDLVGFIRFLDYGQNPEGGASALVRSIRAFAAAGVSNRLIGLFDNDTAARDALLTLDTRRLPANMRVISLPDTELADSYPTIGPTGRTNMNVNGLAGGIEMYLGRDVLAGEDGSLAPVQWSGFVKRLAAYQGEVQGKNDIQERFRRKLASAESGASQGLSADWAEMDLLLESIVRAFGKAQPGVSSPTVGESSN